MKQSNQPTNHRPISHGATWLALLLCLILPIQPALAGEIIYYFPDASGSPVLATDEDGGIIWHEHYQPYGEKVNEVCPMPCDDLSDYEDVGYTGHEYDAETGLTYMQARYYDPVVGRFLAIDPVGFKPTQPMTFNRYSYANNNPYKYIDPTGAVALLHWTSTNSVTLTIKYSVQVKSSVINIEPKFTAAQVNARVAEAFSGTMMVNGTKVTVIAKAMQVSPGTKNSNTITIVPMVNSDRAYTTAVGGNQITVPRYGAYLENKGNVVSHELGHASGAGDQYAGGVDVNGNVLPADVPGKTNIMRDTIGPANQQTLKEIINGNTNVNSCASGVSAANGAC